MPQLFAEVRSSGGRGALGALLLGTLLGACAPETSPPEPELRFVAEETDASFGRFLFGPLPTPFVEKFEEEDLQTLFQVFVGEPAFRRESCVPEIRESPPEAAPESPQPSLLGEVKRRGDGLEFIPRFPFSTALTYTACVDLGQLPPAGTDTSASNLRLRHIARSPIAERNAASHAKITAVWPVPGEVPANLLRIYVRFDRPMEARQIAGKINLLRDGEPIADAFVAIPDGLWGPEGKRLTLFLHPGRIKRGVGPRETLGPVLSAGDRVTLRLSASLRSAQGATLEEAHEVSYLITKEDRSLPAPSSWSVEPPLNPTGAVRIFFDEPLDAGILERFAEIQSDQGLRVDGIQSPTSDGLGWSFTPSQPWSPGAYQILATPEIEDLAGNTPFRAFDLETRLLPEPGRRSPETASAGKLSFEFLVE